MKLPGSELTRGDLISLGKAVAKFNRTVNELKREENKTYLPAEIKYTDVRDTIVKKTELDRYIKNLRRFNEKNADVYITESGEKITKWERSVIERERKTAINRMEKELEKANKYDKDTIRTLTTNISNLKNIEKLTKEDFKNTIKRIHSLGRTDYRYRKALQFRENFYKALDNLKNYENFDKFKEKLDSYKNPYNFFNFVQKSDYFADLFVKYMPGVGVTTVIGNFETDEDAFNYALENDYGIKIE